MGKPEFSFVLIIGESRRAKMLRGHVRIEPDFKSGVGVRREGTSSEPGLVFSARLDVLGSHLVLGGKRFLRHLFFCFLER